MTRIIALANQKGGCAKTTTAINLAAGLSLHNKKVLLIDVDPQANATSVFIEKEAIQQSIYHVLFENVSPQTVIIQTNLKNLFLLPSDIELSATDLKLSDTMGREKLLYHKVKNILDTYDYVIIDTPPSLGLLTVNAFTTAKEILIPISTSYFALKGVKLLESTIGLVRENLDQPELRILGVVCTIFDPITNVSKNTLEMIKEYFKQLVMETVITKNIKLEEAHSFKKTIFEYDMGSRGAQDYEKLTKEILAYEPKDNS